MLKSIVSLIMLTGCMAACTLQAEEGGEMEDVPLMVWSDLTSRDLPDPTSSHAYGDDPAQIVDLWLPEGEGPHPTVLMIHGGCWQKAIADRTLMNYAAEDLRQRGLAVWNIEYRGVDEDGGGYPGTFEDVRAATEKLIELGPSLNLEVDRIVAFGHSAGGHLAAWALAQSNIEGGGQIMARPALPIIAVINSGGLADLEASAPITLESCLASIMDDLTGAPTETRPNVFSDTSVSNLLPTSGDLISVNGDRDRIAPPELGQSLTEKVISAGAQALFVEIPQTGHVELIAPGTEAFEVQADLIESFLTP